MAVAEQREGFDQEIAETHWIDVAGGQLQVRSCGSGLPVIFLHGWTLDWRNWIPQLPLRQHMRLVLPDRRGFGRSTAPPKLTAEKDDIDAILAYFGVTKCALIGLSQGAAVALDYARYCPDRLNAAVVIGAPLHDVVPEPENLPEIDRLHFADLVRNGRLNEMMAQWRRHPLTTLPAGDGELLKQIFADYDGRDQLVVQEPLLFSHSDIAMLASPILAIAGENDSVWRKAVAQYIGSHAPRGSTEIISDAGHLANIDQPEHINSLLDNFLRANHHEGL